MGEPQYRVTVGDIDIPFGRLVAFFVKATLAAIPAALIVWLIVVMLWAIVRTIFGLSFLPHPAF